VNHRCTCHLLHCTSLLYYSFSCKILTLHSFHASYPLPYLLIRIFYYVL
jgi:hypothetical protein